jgi:threonine/homoserine/homoserine lactone efflux protein
MTIESTIALAIAMLILATSPGPGVFASVAQALAAGFRSSINVIAGIVVGDLIFLMLAIFGLSAIAYALGELFFIVKIGGGAYLVWLGYKMWTAEPVPPNSDLNVATRNRGQRFLSGLFITLSNPKVIIFYCGFLPTFMDLRSLSFIDIAIVAAVVSIVLGSVMTIYAYFASRTRSLFTRRRSVRILNRCAGTVLVGTGIVIATR